MKTEELRKVSWLTVLLSWLFGSQLPAPAAALDAAFNPGLGTDGLVEDIALQPDGKMLISGAFTHVNGKPHNYIARLNADGSLDNTFTAGANDWVRCMARQSDGKILIGGKFTSVNGMARGRIARLNADGSLDTTFDPGTGATGPVFPFVQSDIPFVWGIAPQSDGHIVICGGFTNYNGTFRKCVARINSNGSLDATFDSGAGCDNWVKSCYVLPGGRVMLAGWFQNYDNQYNPRIVRLLGNGKVDTTFKPITWGDRSSVYTLSFQRDGKILICGHFSLINGSAHEKMARLVPDGTVDETFNASANDFVEDIKVRSDGKVLIGGYFSDINGTRRTQIALLNSDGSVDPYFSAEIDEYVWMMRVPSADKVVIGGAFHSIDGTTRNGIGRLNMPMPIPHGSIFFQQANSEIVAWLNNGAFSPVTIRTGPSFAAGWRLAGVGDFNQDEEADFVWLNEDGRAALWLMNGKTVFKALSLRNWPGASSGWQLLGTGDFNGDGSTDLAWENRKGQTAVWLMDGTNFVSASVLRDGQAAAPGWRAVAIGDFNADSKPDILWQNTEGSLAVWLMNGTLFGSAARISASPGRGWQVTGAGDFNFDNKPDILFRNANGQLMFWRMNGTSFVQSTLLRSGEAVAAETRIVGIK